MKNLALLLAVLFFVAASSSNSFAQAFKPYLFSKSVTKMKAKPKGKAIIHKEKKANDNCTPCRTKIREARKKYQQVANNMCQDIKLRVTCCINGQEVVTAVLIKPNAFHCNGNDHQ